MSTNRSDEIVIIGAGVIGLSVGWRLSRAGARVTILERGQAGREASWLAAGMLAADAEIGFEEMDLYRLCRESLRRWPEFAETLVSESGIDVDLRSGDTLVVADDPDSAAALRRVYDFQIQHDLDVKWLSGDEAREMEPFLAPRLAAAVLSPHDRQVDNRSVVVALVKAFQRSGGELRENANVVRIDASGKPAAVLDGGERINASKLVVAAGAWSRQIGGLPDETRPSVRPVKGQMAELRMTSPFNLARVVRGPHAYLAPKSDGRLLVGATSEEMGFDTNVTAGGLYEILQGAWEIVPGIYDLPVSDVWAGLRPATLDHRPLLGVATENIVFATGHYRHGILLAPITADEISKLMLENETSKWIAPFSPTRPVAS